jgi:formylglycine-generating enzyme required for sulfatase activity
MSEIVKLSRRSFIQAFAGSSLFLLYPNLIRLSEIKNTVGEAKSSEPEMVSIPSGVFAMGDHYGYVDPKHPTDEIPVHDVSISSFIIGKTTVTVQQYCDYLNSANSQGLIRVTKGLVYAGNGDELLFQTRQADQYSRIGWDGNSLQVLDGKGEHPITSVMWHGAAAYCNWLSAKQNYQPCYDPVSWACDFIKNGYRLPTEAEWEYAARGGEYNPYFIYPWGNEIDKKKANIPNSGDPYESGPTPWTTPVDFYNGELRLKKDFNWPSNQENYQTSNGANSYGLFDMAGNAWQWCNDWYGQNYYSVSPYNDPTGPTTGTPMPDGRPYRVLRGGNWYNGEDGHARVSNRDPAYYRGPQDPNHPYYHVGFRVARKEAHTGIATFTTSATRTSEISTTQRTALFTVTDTGALAASRTVSAAPPVFKFPPEPMALAGLAAAAVGLYVIERRRRRQRPTKDRGTDKNGGELEKK